jgi:hypothetical protein
VAARALQRRRRNPGAADWLQAHRWELLGAGAVVVAGVVWPYLDASAPDWLPINWLTGGARLDDIEAPKAGWIDTPPQALADAAGVDVETYSLARAMRSEGGTSEAKRIAVAWAMLNHARQENGGDITATVTGPAKAPKPGLYGAQNIPKSLGLGAARYVSTARPPRKEDVTLAQRIQAGEISDPTHGAEFFFEPALQDQLVSAGTPGYSAGSQAVIDRWTKSGYATLHVPGALGVLFFRRGSLTS